MNTATPAAALLEVDGRAVRVDLHAAHDLAIVQDFNGAQPHWFTAPEPRSIPLHTARFSGRVNAGASCNCSTLSITPHCDGTHTEGAGHLTAEALAVRTVVPIGFLPALLLSVCPVAQAGELLITADALAAAWPVAPLFAPRALVLRTLPNTPLKCVQDYRTQPAAFFALGAAQWLVTRGIEHLVLDLPSADRADDGGHLYAHREFFGLPAGATALTAVRRPQCTITELAYIDSAVPDGAYLLCLQIPALGGDALPSRPVLFPVRPA